MTRSVQTFLTRLEEISGSAHILTDADNLALRQVDGLLPTTVVRPADAAQIAEILRFAASEHLAVIPCGGCTKLGIGSPPSQYDIALDLSRMNRVLAYDPHDLTLGTEPGVRIEDLLRALAEEKQFLPVAVPFLDRATIGGIVATNSSSLLRHSYGGIRDFCLGMEFVTGEGIAAKSGGRVVKNVTGYDLHKLLIGSLGTLAVITRINFRTFPLPIAQRTFVASFLNAPAAFAFCTVIAHSVLMPQVMEVADPLAADVLFSGDTSARIAPSTWSVIISTAGPSEVVERYSRELGHLASTVSAEEFVALDEAEAPSVLSRVREFPRLILDATPSAAIFRVGVVPTVMAGLLGEIAKVAATRNFDLVTLTRASGILYAALMPKEGDTPSTTSLAQASREVFDVCAKFEFAASAMLEWCPAEVKKAAGGVWGTARPDFELMQRVKTAFDPQGVLSPARYAGGI